MNSPALQLGVSHQTPKTLTPERMRFLRQMGVEKIEVRIPSSASGYDDICRVRETVERAGLGIHEIMLADRYSCRPIALGLPDSGAEIDLFKRFIRDLGRAGVGVMTYAWHTRRRLRHRAHRDARFAARACFSSPRRRRCPTRTTRRYSHDELWDNYAAFIREILPVAEDSGVRLQLHPNDPPVDHQGVPRLFSSRGGVPACDGGRRPQPALRNPVLRRLLRGDVRPRRQRRGRGRRHLRIRQAAATSSRCTFATSVRRCRTSTRPSRTMATWTCTGS